MEFCRLKYFHMQISHCVQAGHKDIDSVSCAAYIAELLTTDNGPILTTPSLLNGAVRKAS